MLAKILFGAIVGVVAYLIARYVADVAMRQQQTVALDARPARKRLPAPDLVRDDRC